MNVEHKVSQARDLAAKGKYARALDIVKKVNAKAEQQSFLSLIVEGVCQQNLNRFPQAESAYKKASKFMSTDEEKLNIYRNLKTLYLAQEQKAKAIDCLVKEIDITTAINNPNTVLQLCQLCFEEQQIDQVIHYAKQLIGLNDFWTKASMFMAMAYNEKRDRDEAFKYLHKMMQHDQILTEQQTADCLMYLLRLDFNDEAAAFLAKIEPRYPYSSWTKRVAAEISNRTADDDASDIDCPKDRVIGENKEMIKLIESLLLNLEEMGAVIHDKLRIFEDNGELSIKAYTPLTIYNNFMQVPILCMPLENDYDFSLDENKHLVVKSKPEQVNPFSARIMDLMAEIYNAAEKFKHWASVYPLVALRNHPEISLKLMQHRAFNRDKDAIVQMIEKGQWDELTIKSYFNSRTFSFSKERLAEMGLETVHDYEKGVLTVIDFTNHRLGASNYTFNNEGNALDVISTPDPETREVFVQYNLSDLMSAYLVYGFVDRHYQWVKCKAMTLQTKLGVTITIANAQSNFTNQLPVEKSHLRVYLPGTITTKDNKVTLSHITVPKATQRDIFREVLEYILILVGFKNHYKYDMEFHAEVDYLEQQIISNNKKYWQELNDAVENANKDDKAFPQAAYRDITDLCGIAIDHFEAYE